MNTTLQYLIDNNVYVITFLFIISMVFICFGHIYRDQVQLVLKKPLATFPKCDIDWWSVSHVLLYAICGILVPDRPLTFFTLGLGFELLEDYLSRNEDTQLVDCKNNPNSLWCNGIETDYWYMNPSDPWMNLTGYIIGSAIRTTWLS
jgi:hypothetical protein